MSRAHSVSGIDHLRLSSQLIQILCAMRYSYRTLLVDERELDLLTNEVRLEAPHDDVPLRLLVSLPPEYPASHPPQLQLLSRYIGGIHLVPLITWSNSRSSGPYAVDSNLFGLILRTYIAHLDRGVEFSPDIVCVFDGVQSVLHLCQKWYEEKLSEAAALEVAREAQRGHQISLDSESSEVEQQGKPPPPLPPAGIPKDVEIFVSEPIVDRKSSFIGRACRISDPAQVSHRVHHLRASPSCSMTGSSDTRPFDVRSSNSTSSTPYYQCLEVSSGRCHASR
jgi:hypothetical protein